MKNLNQYAKAIAAIIGTGLTTAITYYPHTSWLPIASAVCTVIAVYAVPNTPTKPPTA